MVRVGHQRLRQVLHGQRAVAAGAVDAAHLEQACAAPAELPRGVRVQRIRRVEVPAQPLQTCLLVDGLRVGRVVVAQLEAGDGPVKIRPGGVKVALLDHRAAHGQIAAQVLGIAPQGLHVVVLRHVGVVLVLLQMRAVQIQLLQTLHLRGLRRDGARLGLRLFALLRGLIRDEAAPGAVRQRNPDVRLPHALRHRHRAQHRVVRVDAHRLAQQLLFARADAHFRAFPAGGRDAAHREPVPIHAEGERRLAGRVGRRADAAGGIPDLREGLRLARHDIGEVRLVVREHARHQLDVAVVVVRQVGAPGATEVAVAPRPHLLADGVVVIRHGDRARVRFEVVAAEEVHVALPAHDHDRGGQLDVRKPRGIGALAVVERTGCMEHALHHGEGDHRAAVVVIAPLHIRREGGLVVLVDAHGQVVPPHERQGRVRAVAHDGLRLHHGGAGVDRDADRGAHPVEGLRLAHPAGLRAVRILLQGGLRGHEGGGPVVLRPVELHAAGDPRSRQTDHGWLDADVLVDELVAVALLRGAMDFSAQLRQQLHLDVLVLQGDHVVGLVDRRVAQPVRVRDGVDPAGRPLIRLFLQKERQFVRLRRHIRRQDPLFALHFNSHF